MSILRVMFLLLFSFTALATTTQLRRWRRNELAITHHIHNTILKSLSHSHEANIIQGDLSLWKWHLYTRNSWQQVDYNDLNFCQPVYLFPHYDFRFVHLEISTPKTAKEYTESPT